MRAAVVRDRRLVVADMPAPEPGPGEVLVKTLACGICGSDLHALKHAERFFENYLRPDGTRIADLGRDIVMGHEFCAEIVDHGPRTERRLKTGTRVCSMPMLQRPEGRQTIGYSNDHPGGYAEYMRLTEALLLEVPNGLATERAALTEPMAVGLHAVNKARLASGDKALVVGCGPVGLAVIAALRLQDVRPIVAADFSPRRRELAAALGADEVIDPAPEVPTARWREATVVFECVGVPGVIDRIMAGASRGTRVVIVGVCMEPDTIHPLRGISKELSLQFVLGYDAAEFAATLRHIAEGALPAAPLVTGKVGVDGVAAAFDALASPERHAKILVEPWRTGATIDVTRGGA
ncbi:MAG: zinc-binding dehydrogenase [Candidatus Rokubacteria bacterium]|nr:zinc-binding dehydrogenase [Candidatus Rokubacteria bacterium]